MYMAATRNTAFGFLMAASLAACGGTSSGPVMEHKIGLVYFGPDEAADMCMKGLFDRLKEQGIEERVNLEVRRSHAQGEFANIPLLIQNYDSSDVDVIVALTTPVLTAAAAMARSKPVVFTYVYDPIKCYVIEQNPPAGTLVPWHARVVMKVARYSTTCQPV